MRLPLLAALAMLAVPALAAAPAAHVLVFCSPGSPGTTAEAQPTMDAFAAAVGPRAGLPELAAVYHEAEDAGVARLRAKDAAAGVVSLPFFLKHERALSLVAKLQPLPAGRPPTERWSLVAKKGRVSAPSGLARFTIASTAGYAPAFVRGPGVGAWGPLPASVKVTFAPAILSALRRAAAGEDLAVLLDGAQAAALPSLPFAADLEVVTRSASLPSGVLALVDQRLSTRSWDLLDRALRGLGEDPAARPALEGVRISGFGPVDAPGLSAARKAYAEAAE